VTSPTYPVERSKKNESTLTLSKRVLFIFLACCIQMIYIPTSNRIAGGIEPKLAIDIFPVWPVWVLPYILCYVLWFSSMAWIILKTEDRLFRSFLAACVLTFSIGATTFIFFPTYVRPATVEGNDIFAGVLRMIHGTWGRYDAFPSGHVYITTLLTLFFSRWYPRWKYVWIATLIVVSLSTLFTGQHYILDVLGGYLTALAGYYFGLWWAGFYTVQKRSGKRSRRRMPSSSFN
jgi:membrane-associated phospholipid phosphatase